MRNVKLKIMRIALVPGQSQLVETVVNPAEKDLSFIYKAREVLIHRWEVKFKPTWLIM